MAFADREPSAGEFEVFISKPHRKPPTIIFWEIDFICDRHCGREHAAQVCGVQIPL
jgi:hypothetical protein